MTVALCVLALLITQLYGNWNAAARERTAHPEESVAPPCPVEQRTLMGRFHVVPLVSWSQFIIFSHVLDKGKAIAPSVERGVPRRSMFGRRGETLLCIVLLLCGDVQLNPGPVVLPMASQHQPQFNSLIAPTTVTVSPFTPETPIPHYLTSVKIVLTLVKTYSPFPLTYPYTSRIIH
uniref:Uncharacterized protein n=1 Tax=Knipowitschia caucasica TaxID=637954 RepID=A0AAV2LTY8_KNICA